MIAPLPFRFWSLIVKPQSSKKRHYADKRSTKSSSSMGRHTQHAHRHTVHKGIKCTRYVSACKGTPKAMNSSKLHARRSAHALVSAIYVPSGGTTSPLWLPYVPSGGTRPRDRRTRLSSRAHGTALQPATWPLPGCGTRPHCWRVVLSPPEQGSAPQPAPSAWPPP